MLVHSGVLNAVEYLLVDVCPDICHESFCCGRRSSVPTVLENRVPVGDLGGAMSEFLLNSVAPNLAE